MDQEDGIKITKLRALIRDIPDFPKPGIVFKDITPLLADPAGLSLAVEYLTQPFRNLHPPHQRRIGFGPLAQATGVYAA